MSAESGTDTTTVTYSPREVLGDGDRRWLVAAPLVFLALGIVASFALAPDLSSEDERKDFAPFFGTIAQLLGALLIAVVVEARTVASLPRGLATYVASTTVLFIGVGMAASVTAMSDELPGCWYAPLFGASVSSGAAALAAVLVLAMQALRRAFVEHAVLVVRERGDEMAALHDKPPPDGAKAASSRHRGGGS